MTVKTYHLRWTSPITSEQRHLSVCADFKRSGVDFFSLTSCCGAAVQATGGSMYRNVRCHTCHETVSALVSLGPVQLIPERIAPVVRESMELVNNEWALEAPLVCYELAVKVSAWARREVANMQQRDRMRRFKRSW